MKKILFLALACLSCQIFAKGEPDTLQIGREDWVYRSKNFIAVLSSTTKPKDTVASYILKVRQNTNIPGFIPGKRKSEFVFPSSSPVGVSFSDDGTMIISAEISGYNTLAQCIDRDGKVLWQRPYNEPDYDDKLTNMIISPNGKFALLTASDSCIIFSGIDGKRISSRLEPRVKGNYTAFFDKDSKVIAVCANWHLIKYDPERDTIVLEKQMKDTTNGTYTMELNRQKIANVFNLETGLFGVVMMESKPLKPDSNNSCLLVFDCDLNIRIFKDLHGVPPDGLKNVTGGILMRVAYKKNKKRFSDLRLYTTSLQEPIILDNNPEFSLDFATQKNNEIIYYGKGAKTFWKYNIKNVMISKDTINNASLMENDSLNFFKLQ
jgi:hypothetical protein